MFLGGRVQFGEDTLNGIKREIVEEIGLKGEFSFEESFMESKEHEYEIF